MPTPNEVVPPVEAPPVETPPVETPPAETPPESSSMFKSLFDEVNTDPEHIEAARDDYDPIRRHGYETVAQKLSNMDEPPAVETPATEEGSEKKPVEGEKPAEGETPAVETPAPTPVQFSRKHAEKPAEEVEEPEVKVEKPETPAEDLKADEFEASLLPAEKEHYDLLKFASDKVGGEFAGMDKKFADFVTAHRKFVQDAMNEDPEVTFDGENELYQKFLRANQPALSQTQFKKIEREQIKDEVRNEMKDSVDSTNQKLDQLEKRPVVQKKLDDLYNLMDTAMPEDMRKAMAEGGDTKVLSDFPIEHPIVADLIPRYTAMGKAFVEVDSGLVKFNPKNLDHAEMRKFLDIQIEHVRGSKHAVRDEKQFCSPIEYDRMSKADKATHWTLTAEEQISAFRYAAEADINAIVKREYDRLEKAGFTRKAAGTPPVEPPEERESLKSKPSVSPGSATPTETKEPRSPYARVLLDSDS
jgi:hypothetical protein